LSYPHVGQWTSKLDEGEPIHKHMYACLLCLKVVHAHNYVYKVCNLVWACRCTQRSSPSSYSLVVEAVRIGRPILSYEQVAGGQRALSWRHCGRPSTQVHRASEAFADTATYCQEHMSMIWVVWYEIASMLLVTRKVELYQAFWHVPSHVSS